MSTAGENWFWRTFREWVADLSSADDLPGLYSLVTTLGRARDAVVAGPSNRTAGDSRKVSQSQIQFSRAVDKADVEALAPWARHMPHPSIGHLP